MGRIARAAIAACAIVTGTAGARAQLPPAAPARLDAGRVTIVFYPSEARLARTVANAVVSADSFPGLPKPKARILIALAPDAERFREWVGPAVPEWGAAVAFPGLNRIVMQGASAGSDAGDPMETLRHELAHLALHEAMGDLPPRWFDEGYASFVAREWRREDALSANLGLLWRGMPTLDELEAQFEGGSVSAQEAYALAYRAVYDLADIGGEGGLELLFARWKESGSLDRGIRSAFGITLADFEDRWRSRTRRRYGALAVVSNVAAAGSLVGLLILPLFLARRRRDRARLRAMVAADRAAEAAAAADPLSILLDATSKDAGNPPRPPAPS